MTTTEYPTSIIPLKGSPVVPAASSTTTAATLRSLYNRAARAFLHRDIEQTHALIASAFSLLHPPPGPAPDALAEHRRKWDVLRITLDTTVYAAPTADDKAVPAALRDTRALAAPALIQALHDRSLALFTPAAHAPRKPSAAFLPAQVLITLVLSSLKLDCPDAGRTLIEDWLAKRGQFEESQVDGEGYEKVLDMYCLHVLPRLEEWDYAKEFLQYEGELPADKRNALASSLQTLHTETLDARKPPSPPRTPTPTPAHPTPAALRAVSPAPSAASSSSSLSTTSTHTVVPRTPNGHGLARLAPSLSSASIASDATVKHTRPPAPRSRSLSSNVSTSSVPRPPRAPTHPAAVRAPTTLALLRASLAPLGGQLSGRVYTFVLLFVLIPLISLVLRIRRRQASGVGGVAGVGAADAVRRRLAAAGAGAGVVGRVWSEVVRAVGDTVRMGGGGLV
ncbi:hypothetical protein HWV62_43399 [Athelia sp. TMB]|nr:hypothetical protein HWV62_43399 [Athelia sp. TMB]